MSPGIQVFVRWKEQTIFAGEDVECHITFKNVAPEEPEISPKKHTRGGSRPINGVIDGTNYSPAKSFNPFNFSGHRRLASTGHQPKSHHRQAASTSLASPLSFSRSFPPANSPSNSAGGSPSTHRHKRSLSILSVETDATTERKSGTTPFAPKPVRGHGRSASVQVTPTGRESYGNWTPSSLRSPVYQHSSTDLPSNIPSPDFKRPQLQSPASISSPSRRSPRRQPSPLPTDFKFPQAPPPNEADETVSHEPPSKPVPSTQNSPRPAETTVPAITKLNGTGPERPTHLAPATKILSNSTVNGSSRSSMEFGSLSNHSSETVESESVANSASRSRYPVQHRRHFSSLEPAGPRSDHDSQSLLMGYAQINASFTVDGSLVNHNLFEDVKRKGVVGTHGRGDAVSQSEKSKGGFLGNLGLGVLTDSIGGLLSGGELDGLRDMRGASSSESIPLLSTPQSLLFVDLRLKPGEEKSFSFSFTLPKGLPASHRGKSIKISYNLVIGTQRAGNPKEPQRVRRINIPFRVLSGVDEQGQVLGHDIMRPYVLLRDEARVQKLDHKTPIPMKSKSISGKVWSSSRDFLSYVDEILDQNSRRETPHSLGSPLEVSPGHGITNESFSCKDAIDLAVLRSNQTVSSDRSANRFEISRNGRRIAVIILNRPAHRLGEVVVATVDFSDAVLPCYSLRGSLETSEKINPSIALRSGSSISRATRRVHATCFENTLFSNKVAFAPAIPVSATPSFITSGVSLEWQLRFEFVTCSTRDDVDDILPAPSGTDLLEPVERDDRGTVFTSVESVSCQSFEIGIPLTVYGGTVQEPGGEESRGIPI